MLIVLESSSRSSIGMSLKNLSPKNTEGSMEPSRGRAQKTGCPAKWILLLTSNFLFRASKKCCKMAPTHRHYCDIELGSWEDGTNHRCFSELLCAVCLQQPKSSRRYDVNVPNLWQKVEPALRSLRMFGMRGLPEITAVSEAGNRFRNFR